jgi:hypothetical protein
MPYCHDSHVGPHAATASKHGHNVMRTPPLHPNMATTSCARRHRVQTRPQHHPHAAPASKHGHNIMRTPPLHPNMATTSSARRHCVQTRPQHHPHVAPASKHGHNINIGFPRFILSTFAAQHCATSTLIPTLRILTPARLLPTLLIASCSRSFPRFINSSSTLAASLTTLSSLLPTLPALPICARLICCLHIPTPLPRRIGTAICCHSNPPRVPLVHQNINMDRRTGTSNRHSGLSKSSIRHGFRRSQRNSQLLHATKQAERRSANEAKRRSTIHGNFIHLCMAYTNYYRYT